MDDAQATIPKNANVKNELRMLNSVDHRIKLTDQVEMDNKIPFLETVMHQVDKCVKYSVYRKPTKQG